MDNEKSAETGLPSGGVTITATESVNRELSGFIVPLTEEISFANSFIGERRIEGEERKYKRKVKSEQTDHHDKLTVA